MKFRKTISTAVLAAGFISLIQPAQAEIYSFSGVGAYAGNSYNPNELGQLAFSGDSYAVVTSLSGNTTFSGINSSGNAASMTFTYDGKAQSTATSLKAYASASLSNGFYNAANPAYSLGRDPLTGLPIVDPMGVPSVLGFSAIALYRDQFAVTAASNLAYITFDTHVDGTMRGTAGYQAFSGATLFSSLLPIWNDVRDLSNTISVNQTVNSGRIDVTDGFANIDISLQAFVQFSLSADVIGGNEDLFGPINPLLESTSDFFNTATIGTFYGYDTNGNPVDLISLTSGDGQRFDTFRVTNTANVPEPESLALVGLALGLLGASRKKFRIN